MAPTEMKRAAPRDLERSLTGTQLSEYLAFARETAVQAGNITLRYFQRDPVTELKSDDSPVTIADREAELHIRRSIESAYPSHAILGEEFGGPTDREEKPTWIIDPIDGTRAFVRGIPLYGVLMGLEIEGEIRVGVAHFPALSETIAAAEGLGCWWNDRPARVSSTEKIQESLVVHCNAARFRFFGKHAAWERIKKSANYLMGLGDAYGYLLVATGRAEVMLDARMSVWDCAPFPVIFREAGGFFGDWKGEPTIYSPESLATTQTLLPELLALLNGG